MAPKRILLVDDEADICEVAKVSLEVTAGWEVETASTGPEAVALAACLKPDAILLDVMMPGMDGPTTLAALRSNPATRRIPVLFLTAKCQAKDQQWLIDLGIAGILPKPFDPLRLSTEISLKLGWA